MNELKFSGRITAVPETSKGVSKAGKEWAKKKFIVSEETGEYPNSMMFTCFKQEQFEKIILGRNVTVKFDAKVREYEGKYYQDITSFSVEVNGEKEGGLTRAEASARAQELSAPAEPMPVFSANEQDDLPF